MREEIVSDLREILGHDGETFNISPLPQDASMRRYYRISGAALRGPAVAGESIILMVLADPSPRAAPEEITAGAIHKSPLPRRIPREDDLDFVAVLRHFEAIGVPVPKLYRYNIEAGLLYLEDLGNNLLTDFVRGSSPEEIRPWYEKAIDMMIVIHEDGSVGATYMSPLRTDFVGFRRGFDEELLFSELKHYVEYGIEARKGIKVSHEDLEVIEKHMRQISAELAAEFRLGGVLSHRDFQSRNLILQGDPYSPSGRLRIIDFQDALMGTRQYDLVSLLRDSYVVLKPELVDHLIRYYIDKITLRTGRALEETHFRRIFDLQTLQRKIKDAGRFDYIDIVKKNPKFLRYIPDTLGYVKEAFRRLPEHEPLQRKLARYTPELRKF